MAQRVAVAACALIVVLDWAQPLWFAWRPKHVGALLGGLLYLVGAVAISRGVRPLGLVVAAMPAIPLVTLTLVAAGVALPVTPDGPMYVVLSVQIVAAVAAASWWWRSRPTGNASPH